MFLSRSLPMAPQVQQRCLSSEWKPPYHWRPVSAESLARSSRTNDLKRPPLLLIKSFLNLRHKETNNMLRVVDEFSFRPHRIIFIDVMKMTDQRLV
ncbi:hypothetical protein KR038_003533 [Drosophila bunnanda]|nr:hypothetical protein KR038_003533 [Drosophila bunnanda]